MFLLILEREEEGERGGGWGGETEREREKHQCERETLILVCTMTGAQTHNLLVYGMRLQPNEPPGQGCDGFFLMFSYCCAHHLHGAFSLIAMSNKLNLFNYRCVLGALWVEDIDTRDSLSY